MNLSHILLLFYFLNHLSTESSAQTTQEKATDELNQRSLFGLAKSLIIDYFESEAKFDHWLVSHAEKCPFYCLSTAKPFHNPKYKPEPNGCGAYDLSLDFSQLNMDQITDCCNEHDICYGTCNAKKDECDRKFSDCLSAYCQKAHHHDVRNICLKGTSMLYESVKLLGCVAYIKSQTIACVCS